MSGEEAGWLLLGLMFGTIVGALVVLLLIDLPVAECNTLSGCLPEDNYIVKLDDTTLNCSSRPKVMADGGIILKGCDLLGGRKVRVNGNHSFSFVLESE